MLSHWFLGSLVFDVRLIAGQTYTECILHFSDVLDGIFFTLNQVNHIFG